jgi:hypothetical protein
MSLLNSVVFLCALLLGNQSAHAIRCSSILQVGNTRDLSVSSADLQGVLSEAQFMAVIQSYYFASDKVPTLKFTFSQSNSPTKLFFDKYAHLISTDDRGVTKAETLIFQDGLLSRSKHEVALGVRELKKILLSFSPHSEHYEHRVARLSSANESYSSPDIGLIDLEVSFLDPQLLTYDTTMHSSETTKNALAKLMEVQTNIQRVLDTYFKISAFSANITSLSKMIQLLEADLGNGFVADLRHINEHFKNQIAQIWNQVVDSKQDSYFLPDYGISKVTLPAGFDTSDVNDFLVRADLMNSRKQKLLKQLETEAVDLSLLFPDEFQADYKSEQSRSSSVQKGMFYPQGLIFKKVDSDPQVFPKTKKGNCATWSFLASGLPNVNLGKEYFFEDTKALLRTYFTRVFEPSSMTELQISASLKFGDLVFFEHGYKKFGSSGFFDFHIFMYVGQDAKSGEPMFFTKNGRELAPPTFMTMSDLLKVYPEKRVERIQTFRLRP